MSLMDRILHWGGSVVSFTFQPNDTTRFVQRYYDTIANLTKASCKLQRTVLEIVTDILPGTFKSPVRKAISRSPGFLGPTALVHWSNVNCIIPSSRTFRPRGGFK